MCGGWSSSKNSLVHFFSSKFALETILSLVLIINEFAITVSINSERLPPSWQRVLIYLFLDENPESFRRAARNPPKRKESESAQSGSAGSESGSDSSGSGDSDSDSDSESSTSETPRSVKKPVALQIRNLSGRSNGKI